MSPDLFGGQDLQAAMDAPMTGPRKHKRKATAPRGHAWTPGTGPAGESCGTCAHKYRKRMSGSFLKCAKNRAAWTGGSGSDIRAGDPACKFWSQRQTLALVAAHGITIPEAEEWLEVCQDNGVEPNGSFERNGVTLTIGSYVETLRVIKAGEKATRHKRGFRR